MNTEPEVQRPGVEPAPAESPSPRLPGIVTAVLLAGLLIFLVGGIVKMDVPSGASSPGPLVFPIIVAALTAVLLIAQLIALFRPVKASMKADLSPSPTGVSAPGPTASEDDSAAALPGVPEGPVNVRAVLGVAVAVAVFIAILQPLGWLLSATLLFAGVGVALGERRPFGLAAGGLAIASLVQLGFGGALGLALPPGVLAGVF